MSVLSVSKPPSALEFYPVIIRDIRPETENMTVITFEPRDDDTAHFAFVPGQFVILRANIEGEDIRRAYSLCSVAGDSKMQVGIKHIKDGVFSSWMRESLSVGDTLEVLPPDGRFLGEDIDVARGDYVGIAAGSGITPIMSIMQSVLAAEGDSTFTLYYGNRNTASMAFRNKLLDLKNRFMNRLQLVHVLSREQHGDSELTSGRLEKERIKQLLDTFSPQAIDRAFICGPDDMMMAARDVLMERGLDTEDIRIESFGDFAPHEHVEHDADEVQVDVQLTLNGRTSTFKMYHSDTLLEAGHESGVPLPYACKGGVCATCRCKVTKGDVEMDKNYALTESELAEGWILSCRAKPITDEIELTFDT